MGHGGRYCPLCRSGSRLEHSFDPDGKAHHVQPPEKSQVRPKQEHSGHRRQRQRQDPVLRQALAHADAQQLCGHRSQRTAFVRGGDHAAAGRPQAGRERKTPAGCPREGHL